MNPTEINDEIRQFEALGLPTHSDSIPGYNNTLMSMNTYHPIPEINAAVADEMAYAEMIDMKAGYPPRWWKCPDCGSEHNRGHVGAIGCHRCLRCGYVGTGGIMSEARENL